MVENCVIYDCDGGSDDAWALQMLLKAEELKKVHLLAVTIIHGNASLNDAATNVLRVLKVAGRLDVPVYKGSADSILKNNLEGVNFYHGTNGFGGVEFEDTIDTEKLVQKKHAVDAIYEAVTKFPKKVAILSVGPQTNIALCLIKYGEKFAKMVRGHYIMGGNFQAVGNSSSAAEFNFFYDPEAANIVLTRARSPIVILPWEACIKVRWFISVDWRLNVLGKDEDKSPFLKLLNVIERAQLVPKGYTSWEPCDAMLVAAFLLGSNIIAEDSSWNASVELTGTKTRGQMVLDHLQDEKTPKNIRIVEKISEATFIKVAQWAVGLDNSAESLLQ